MIDGIHYVQLALKYPKERENSKTPTDLEDLLIFSEAQPPQSQYQRMKEKFKAQGLAVYELPSLK